MRKLVAARPVVEQAAVGESAQEPAEQHGGLVRPDEVDPDSHVGQECPSAEGQAKAGRRRQNQAPGQGAKPGGLPEAMLLPAGRIAGTRSLVSPASTAAADLASPV